MAMIVAQLVLFFVIHLFLYGEAANTQEIHVNVSTDKSEEENKIQNFSITAGKSLNIILASDKMNISAYETGCYLQKKDSNHMVKARPTYKENHKYYFDPKTKNYFTILQIPGISMSAQWLCTFTIAEAELVNVRFNIQVTNGIFIRINNKIPTLIDQNQEIDTYEYRLSDRDFINVTCEKKDQGIPGYMMFVYDKKSNKARKMEDLRRGTDITTFLDTKYLQNSSLKCHSDAKQGLMTILKFIEIPKIKIEEPIERPPVTGITVCVTALLVTIIVTISVWWCCKRIKKKDSQEFSEEEYSYITFDKVTNNNITSMGEH